MSDLFDKQCGVKVNVIFIYLIVRVYFFLTFYEGNQQVYENIELAVIGRSVVVLMYNQRSSFMYISLP